MLLKSELAKTYSLTNKEGALHYDTILTNLKNRKVLVVLDGCENVIRNDAKGFEFILSELFTRSAYLKLMLTSRLPVSSLVHKDEEMFPIRCLSIRSSYRLLYHRVGRKILQDEILELLRSPIPNQLEGRKVMFS